jgi:hypothetical protein
MLGQRSDGAGPAKQDARTANTSAEFISIKRRFMALIHDEAVRRRAASGAFGQAAGDLMADRREGLHIWKVLFMIARLP